MSQYGSFQNDQYARMESKKDIVIGDGATIILYTDRHAYTVLDIAPNGKRITLQRDNAVRSDKNGMSDCQGYIYTPNTEGEKIIVSLRKDGLWKVRGASTPVVIGHRDEHYDYSF